MNKQSERVEYFRALHVPGDPFILPNAWDIGSAKILAALGARALATTSAGHAFTLGLPDMGHVSRDEALAHAADLVAATPLPVSADLENGYGEAPEIVAETVRLAIEIGLCGLCIEDTALPDTAPYPFELALERIRCAVVAAGGKIVLVARADGVMNAHYDCDEAIRRLQAFSSVGADVLYAPMLPHIADLRRLCTLVDKPVNALVSGNFTNVCLSDFAAAGAARISIGSALARVTHAVTAECGRAMFDRGDFSGLTAGAKGGEIDALLLLGSN